MKALISYLETFDQPPFLVLPKPLKQVFLRQIEKMNCFNPCHLIDEDVFLDKIEPIALVELCQHYQINYYLGSRILEVLPYIQTNQSYLSNKLKTLQEYKEYLTDHSFVIPSQKTRFLLHDFVTAYHPLSMKIPQEINRIDYVLEENPLFQATLFETHNEQDQVHAVIEKIYRLIKDGIDINQIAIVNASNDDLWLLKKEALLYGFTINSHETMALDTYPLVIKLINAIEQKSIEEAMLEFYQALAPDSSHHLLAYNQLMEIIQTYGLGYLESHKKLFLFLIEQATVSQPLIQNAIRVLSYKEAFVETDTFYLVMNYTDTAFPSLKRNDDYLLDSEKKELGIYTSTELNEFLIQELVNRLRTLNQVSLFFPRKIKGTMMRLSDVLPMTLLNKPSVSSKEGFISGSYAYDYLRYQKMTYMMKNFGKNENDYPMYHATFKDRFDDYSPAFKPLKKETTQQLLKNGFNFSPTNLERFNACRFRFLLDYLLKILAEEPNDSLLFGNIAHEILSKIYTSSDSIEALKLGFIEKLPEPLSKKLSLHVDLFVQRLEIIIDYLKAMEKESLFTNRGFEVEVQKAIDHYPQFSMKGKIDRVLAYEQNQKSYYSVVDYKTGSKKFSFDDYELGIDIQPLFYLNLLKKTMLNQEVIPFGFFYQGINLKRLNQLPNGNELEKALKMNGVAISDTDIVRKFAPNLNIVGFRLKVDGSFQTTDRLVTIERMEAMVASIDKFIDKAIQLINEGDFAINPIPGKDDFDDSPSCKYCFHSSVCYMANRFVKPDEEETTSEEE